MPGKLDAYNLGERGINLVKSPVHKADGDLVLAQNAMIIPYNAQRAIAKRRGMTKINTTAAAGSIFNLIRVSFTDPDSTDVDPVPGPDPDFPPDGGSATWIYTSYGDYVSAGGPYLWTYSDNGVSWGKENTSPALNFWVDAHNAIYDPIDGTGNFYCFCVGGLGIRLYELNGGVSTNYLFELNTPHYCQWIDKDGSTWYFGISSSNTGYVGTWDGATVTDLSWPGKGVAFGHWFNGKLYVAEYGTVADTQAMRVFRYDGSWTSIYTFPRLDVPDDSKPVVYSGCVWGGKMWFTLGSTIGGSFAVYDNVSKVVSMDTAETFTVSNPATTGVFRAPVPFDSKLFVFRGNEGSGGGAPFTGCEAYYTTDGTNWVLDKDLTTVKAGANRVESAREWQGDLYCIVRSSTLHNLLKRDTAGNWSVVIDSAFSFGQYLREGLARSDG